MGATARLVLVVDDDPVIRSLIAECLADEPSVRVAVAPDGHRALELVASERPAVVVLDLLMPRLNGLEVVRRLRADPATRDVRILAMSASERGEHALEAGADAFLSKPFDLDHVCDAVRAQLERAGGLPT
jgi:CheY-like chemotaxis protein